MHPALLIFVVSFAVQAITWIGKDAILEVAHVVYQHVLQRSTIQQRTRLRKDILETKSQLNHTSSKDQFAKWARLKRHSDKCLAQLETVNAQLATSRTGFTLVFKVLLFVLTTIAPMLITTWHRKTPIFYLPPDSGRGDWLGPLGRFLSLPGAPTGAVSATVWSMACKRVISLVARNVKELYQ